MTTYTSQPDEASGIDTYILSSSPTTNYGTSSVIVVGQVLPFATPEINRGLIKFDISSIPSNSSIVSANLYLWVSADDSSNARTLSAYRVLRAWVEAQATWNVYSTGNNWGTAGCSNTSTDREAASIGSASVGASESVGTMITIALNTAKVEEWINGTLTNNGLLLKVDTESSDKYSYDSSSSGTAGERPKLVIEYNSDRRKSAVFF